MDGTKKIGTGVTVLFKNVLFVNKTYYTGFHLGCLEGNTGNLYYFIVYIIARHVIYRTGRNIGERNIWRNS